MQTSSAKLLRRSFGALAKAEVLRGGQVFVDPPAMQGTSGQVYTDNIILERRV